MYINLKNNPFKKDQSLHTISKPDTKWIQWFQFVDMERPVDLSLDTANWVRPTPEHLNSPEVVAELIKADPLLQDSATRWNSLIQ